MTSIKVLKADITTLSVDVIVNAANPTLRGGGLAGVDVDSAIHKAAGGELLEECLTLNGCKRGEAKITKRYKLPAKFVIHTVGPVYGTESEDEAEMLSKCYRASLELAEAYGLKTIAFPCISAGVYGYPFDETVQIAVKTVAEYMKTAKTIEQVYMVCYKQTEYERYKDIFTSLTGGTYV